MNTRRRILTNDGDVVMDILHPNWIYAEVTTTTANQNVAFVYAGYYNRKAIVDGVRVPDSQLTYVDSNGGVKIPTPGFHKIYFFGENGSFLYKNVFGKPLTRYPRGTIEINGGTNGAVKTAIIIETTPPKLVNTTKFTFTEIYVPKECVSAYKTAWPQFATIIKGVTFNIIED